MAFPKFVNGFRICHNLLMSKLYEMTPFNWRLANYHLLKPKNERHLREKKNYLNEMFLTAEHIRNYGLLTIRDWLYDEEYILHRWKFIGVFDPTLNPNKLTQIFWNFKGMSFSFESKIDAALFKLMWDAHRLDGDASL